MMSLLSTIRGKSKANNQPILDEVIPLTPKEKKLIQSEWDRLVAHEPELIKVVWVKSARNSTSIKQAFGMDGHEVPEQNTNFMNLWPTIGAFFKKLIVTYELNDTKLEADCVSLGARHVDFMSRGFHSTFWDIFQVCLTEAIDETMKKYTDQEHRKEAGTAFLHLSTNIIQYMRTGYNNRRKTEMIKQA